MAFEVASFGTLSKIYSNLANSDAKKSIARHFGLASPDLLKSWVHSMVYVRNVCAHHSRLWNRRLTLRPELLRKKPKIGTWPDSQLTNDKIYYFLCCSLFMLRSINPNTRFVTHLKILINRHPNVPLQSMGFPEHWTEETFWQE
jgi:abortive infection bacteriophage resistance protein